MGKSISVSLTQFVGQNCLMKSFREALLEKIEKANTSLRQVALGSGLPYERLKKLNQNPNQTVKADDAVLISNFFGQSVNEMVSAPNALRIEITQALGLPFGATLTDILDAISKLQDAQVGDLRADIQEIVRAEVRAAKPGGDEMLTFVAEIIDSVRSEARANGKDPAPEDILRQTLLRIGLNPDGR